MTILARPYSHTQVFPSPRLSFRLFRQGRQEKAPIYSIDFHPDGSRFATGAGDAKVREPVEVVGLKAHGKE